MIITLLHYCLFLYFTHIYSVEINAPVSSSSRWYEPVTMLAWWWQRWLRGRGQVTYHIFYFLHTKKRKKDFKKYLNCIEEMACSTSKSANFKTAILKMMDSPWGWCCHSERWSAAVTGAHSPDPWMWFRSLGMWRSRGTEPKTALMKRKKKPNEKVIRRLQWWNYS